MNQPRRNEDSKTGHPHADPPVKRCEDQVMRELVESAVPTLSPEFAERRREKRRSHHRRRVNPVSAPNQSRDLERAEVKDKNRTQHTYPSPEQMTACGNRSRQ